MKENGFKKILENLRKFFRAQKILSAQWKELGESIMPLEPMLQFVLLFLK